MALFYHLAGSMLNAVTAFLPPTPAQGSLFGLLLFIMYTTPLNTHISSISLNADDAQLKQELNQKQCLL